jgi:hypothetical protein
MLFCDLGVNYRGMRRMEKGKFLAVRCGEIRSLLRNACFQEVEAIPVLFHLMKGCP